VPLIAVNQTNLMVAVFVSTGYRAYS